MDGAVLVIGAGMAGLRAALDIAKTGVRVVLVEQEPVIGGAMAARLADKSETFDFAHATEIPRVDEAASNPKIEVLTLTEVERVEGEPGAFEVSLIRRARFVTDRCTRCNRCHAACPQVVPNQYYSGLSHRKAIYTPFFDAYPANYVIDLNSCLNTPPNYLPCARCVEACEDHAIQFNVPLREKLTRTVSAVILATGFRMGEPDPLQRHGYGTHPDILTSMELERLITPGGPTGGFVEKPSNSASPDSVLFIMSDASPFATSCAAAQCDRLTQQGVKTLTVLHPKSTTRGESFRDFWARVAHRKVTLADGELERITPGDDGTFRVRYKLNGDLMSAAQDYDMVVFTTPVLPPDGMAKTAEALGIEIDNDGFVKQGNRDWGPNATTRLGVYVAGCVSRPKDIRDSIAESKAAAVCAMRHVERSVFDQEDLIGQVQHSGVMINGRWLTEEELRQRVEGFLSQIMGVQSQERP